MEQFKKRLSALQKVLKDHKVGGLIVEDQINLFYMTGLHLSAGRLLVHEDGAELIVDGRYIEAAKSRSPYPSHPSEDDNILPNLLKKIDTLAFSSDNTTYGGFLQLKKEIDKVNKTNGTAIKLVALDNPVGLLRVTKDETEIETLREAAKLGSEGYDFICTLLKEGVTEAEIAVELEIYWRRHGGQALAFDPIIAFGANSSMPHYRVGNARLHKGDTVLIDIGVNYSSYHSDMTRVVFFGEPPPQMLAIYDIVKEAQKRSLDLCRPGTLIGQLDAAARDYIADEGYGENFSHSLGHGVGLEIHEAPVLRNKAPYADKPLQEGMVITIEPGIYLPGIGGVRLEDTVVITKDGHENLTQRPVEQLILR